MASHDEAGATAVATQLLGKLYPHVAGASVTLEAVPNSSLEDGALAYRVRALAPGDSPVQWVLRAHRAEQRMPDYFCYFYPWACSGTDGSQSPQDTGLCAMDAWLKSRAATLTTLEARAYPAPR